MLTRRSPAAASARAWRASSTPFVVSERSSTPGTSASMRTSAGRSRRTSGSPPVSRTLRTPTEARIPTSRRISSKVSMRSRGNQTGSSGMQ
jgi:hypothetical protein